MRSVDEHLAGCLNAVDILPPIALPPLDALDCLLAEDITAGVALPSFDNSAMDGYAVRIADVADASELEPVVLPVIGDLPAGSRDSLEVRLGTVVRIMTGAPVPAGTEAVVPVEWTDAGTVQVEIRRAPTAGLYVRPTGDDVHVGELLLTAGVRLSARHVGLLCAIGRERVLVRPRPRVVVLSTGSELIEPGRPLGFGQIYDSNGYALAAAAADLGAVASNIGIVADDPSGLLGMIEAQLPRADLLITSGGVSAGAYDVVKQVLSGLGTVRFERVAMQPGMPQGFGTVGPSATPIFTLPGNPVSSMVSFELFVRPVLRKMWGETSLHRHSVIAEAAVDWTSPPGKRQFARGRLERRAGGPPLVTPVGGPGSHLVADLAGATCLAVVPEDVTTVRVGDALRCMLLDRSRR